MKDQTCWITGLVPAVFTPLHPDGSLNLEQIPPIVEHLIADGVSALYVCGGTGEGPSLSTQERIEVGEAYLGAAAGRIPLIIQVGHNSVGEARRLAQHAQAAGAAAISAVPPSFFKISSLDVLIDTLSVILNGAPDLPFYYYHIPRLTDFDLDVVEFLEQAADRLPTLNGVKYSNFTIYEMQACVELDDGRFNILFGSDEMLLSGLVGGAQGAVGSTYNFAAPLYTKVISAFKNGDMAAATKWQGMAAKMIRHINAIGNGGHNGAALKAMMEVIGLDCGPPRLPQVALQPEKVRALHAKMIDIGFFDWGSQRPATAMGLLTKAAG